MQSMSMKTRHSQSSRKRGAADVQLRNLLDPCCPNRQNICTLMVIHQQAIGWYLHSQVLYVTPVVV